MKREYCPSREGRKPHTFQTVRKGPRLPDPLRPSDRSRDSQDCDEKCKHCGATRTRTYYPWLLADLFSV